MNDKELAAALAKALKAMLRAYGINGLGSDRVKAHAQAEATLKTYGEVNP